MTMQAHFDTWKKAGKSLGSMDYQVLSTEGYNNAAGSTTKKLSAGGASVSTRAG
jgi:endo-1,4-beta-xylanase